MSEYFYGQFTPEHLQKMTKGIELYNDEFYWECHEELEHWWLEDTGDNARLVYWAVIQVAAALYHYKNDNIIGARGLIKKAKNKFSRMKEKNVETKVLEQNLSWSELKKIVHALREDFEFDEIGELYKFKFKSPGQWQMESN